jgi:hypothetical protein
MRVKNVGSVASKDCEVGLVSLSPEFKIQTTWLPSLAAGLDMDIHVNV